MNERQFNASPIVFPSVSPKLSSTPSKKLPSNEWHEIGIDLPHKRQTILTNLEEPEVGLSSILSTPSAYTLASQRTSQSSQTPSVQSTMPDYLDINVFQDKTPHAQFKLILLKICTTLFGPLAQIISMRFAIVVLIIEGPWGIELA
ncbi:hypothetical protein A0J61_09056 [Choanephora cucurbitarum]|uniref:Uncharacterized protein n=1 Tax=Choanephora cucurbitarum TaxID=101091 RepID=A0A1C7N2H9_9FUNG|nr:hypothetical protein A0J61_09056 [Choanephora cucurbitarum]